MSLEGWVFVNEERNKQQYIKEYKEATVTKCSTKIFESQVSHSKDASHTTNPKILFYRLRKGKITSIDKCKNIQMELTEEEL